MPKVEILQGEVRQFLSTQPDDQFHACLCDPPYGLTEKRNARRQSPRASSRTKATGFMGMLWDSDVPGEELWTEVLRVLKPGALMLAFGGSRTHHRLMCNLEDSGFQIRDCLIWLYGSGFPKSKNLGDGRGSALKPAWEPIILCQKPFDGTLTDTFAAHRTGALWIDGCRVSTEEDLTGGGNPPMAFKGMNPRPFHEASRERRYAERGGTNFAATPGPRGGDERGRWPANAVLDEEAGEALDLQTGTLKSGANPMRRNSDKFRNTFQPYEGHECTPSRGADAGGASRFYYCPKASAKDRGDGNEHPTVKPTALTEYLSRLLLPPAGESRRMLVPFSGSGSEVLGAMRAGWDEVLGIERESSYVETANSRIAREKSVNGQD